MKPKDYTTNNDGNVSWTLSADKKQPIEGLDEAADAHIRKVAGAAGHPGWDWTTQDIAEAFVAGAEWGAEHLKK